MKRSRWYSPNLVKRGTDDQGYRPDGRAVVTDDYAPYNLIGSACDLAPGDDPEKAVHMPVIDIDHPCRLVESETPGHFHLFIDVEMTWELLGGLVAVGIVEPGHHAACSARKVAFAAAQPWKQAATVPATQDELW